MKNEQNHCSHCETQAWETFPPAVPLALVGNVQYSPGSVVSRTLFDTDEGSLTLFAFDKGQIFSSRLTIRSASFSRASSG